MSEPSPSVDGPLPPALARRVDAACDRFESAWRAGRRPRIEDVLGDFPESARPALLRGLLGLELAYRRLAGEVPDPEQYRLRFPDHPTEVHEALADASSSPDGIDGPPTAGEGAARGASSGPDTARYAAMAPAPPGARYRILRPHARGGLGEVYLAHDEQLRRVVALKEIQAPQADRADCRARFVREAEITGGLEHPGIVPVYELGRYRDGRPYYAMRFIEGDSLREAIGRHHAEDRRLSPGERSLQLRGLLGRFVDACNAVAYAHSRGVIHRDLKPANIMLGPFGETLVVDWGLAKPSAPADPAGCPGGGPGTPGAGGEEDTLPGIPVGTPQYMSPEQAAGEPGKLGPACDVYGLGATLYCLLTGRPPFEDRDVTTVLQRVVRGDFTPPRQVRRDVPRALEAVCLKAMATRPEDRYESVRALAADVESWLAGEPVSAWREPPWTRLDRWTRRHRSQTAAAAATILVALAAVTIAYRREAAISEQLRLAKAESDRWLDRTLGAIEDYYTGVGREVLLGRGEFQGLRQRLLERPLQFYERLASELSAVSPRDERGRALLARGRLKLGAILSLIGRHDEARRQLQEAVRLYDALVSARRDVPDYQEELANGFSHLGSMQDRMGELGAAADSFRRAIVIQTRLVSEGFHLPESQVELAQSYSALGNALHTAGDLPGAIEAQRKAVDLCDRLLSAHPSLHEVRSDLVECYTRLGLALSNQGDALEAIEIHRKAVAISTQLVSAQPDVPEHRYRLANCYGKLGYAYAITSQAKEAADSFRQGVDNYAKLVSSRPNVPVYLNGLASCYADLGVVLLDMRDPGGAVDATRQAVAYSTRLASSQPDVPIYQDTLAASYANLARALEAAGDMKEAVDASRRAVDILGGVAASHPDAPTHQYGLASCLVDLGTLLRETGDAPGAIDTFRRAVDVSAKLVGAYPRDPHYKAMLAASYLNLGEVLKKNAVDVRGAGDSERKAAGLYAELVSAHPGILDHQDGLAAAQANLAGVLHTMGDTRGEIDLLRKVIELRTKLVTTQPKLPRYQSALARNYLDLGEALGTAGDPQSSAEEYHRAIDLYTKLVSTSPGDVEYRSGLGEALEYLSADLHRQGRDEEAISMIRRAIESQRIALDKAPQVSQYRRLLSSHYHRLAQSLRSLGRVDEATDAMGRSRASWPEDPTELYDLACELSRCLPIVRAQEKESLAAEAMGALRAAINAGWSDARRTAHDGDLSPLRDRADFQRVLVDLFDRGFPKDPFERPRE
jgi:serine/threonine-protein kinase